MFSAINTNRAFRLLQKTDLLTDINQKQQTHSGTMASWEEAYKNIFCEDEEDQYYAKEIPNVPVPVLRKHLEAVLEAVISEKLPPSNWAAFKWELLKCEKEWGAQVFTWDASPTQDGGVQWIIGVNWDVLDNDPRRYYLVHMAIEGVWMSGLLPNVWEVIDDAVDDN